MIRYRRILFQLLLGWLDRTLSNLGTATPCGVLDADPPRFVVFCDGWRSLDRPRPIL